MRIPRPILQLLATTVLIGVVGIILALKVPLLLIAGTAISLYLCYLLGFKQEIILYIIVLSLFFEGQPFSFYFGDYRVRVSLLLTVIGCVSLGIHFVMGRRRLRKTPLDLPIIAYLLINFISIYNAAWVSRGYKIALLLLSLAVMYVLVVNMLTEERTYMKAFRVLLWTGVAEAAYGVYQVVAGMLNCYADMKLYVGFLGTTHTEFIGAPWGRPYGTFAEPDWYGTICMAFALLFTYLKSNETGAKKDKLYSVGLAVTVAGLLASFVRSAWLGYVAGLLLYMFMPGSKTRINGRTILKWGGAIFLSAAIAFITLEPLQKVVMARFFPDYEGASFSTQNVRVQQMMVSLGEFVQHPFIGNGPGSGAFDLYKSDFGTDSPLEEFLDSGITEGFNPSVIFTALEDTGVVGLACLLIIGIVTKRTMARRTLLVSAPMVSVSSAWYGVLAGLATSYLFTQGMWLPFTWIFLAFAIVPMTKLPADAQRKDHHA